MCGRFTLHATWDELRQLYELNGPASNLAPRYNIAPTQSAHVLLLVNEGMALLAMRWGLVPSWTKDTDRLPVLINARAESAADKPSFRFALKSRRCLIPASGYYEWKDTGGIKTPYYITQEEPGPMLFAGLWESWKSPHKTPEDAPTTLESCTILTTAASEAMANVHHRMPVILTRDEGLKWLADGGEKLLKQPPQPKLVNCPVSRKVNNVGNEGRELTDCQDPPAPKQPDLFG